MVAGDEESDGDGDEGGGRATATRAKVTAMRAMMTVTGVACGKEVRARVMPKAMRVVRNEEGEGVLSGRASFGYSILASEEKASEK